MDFEFVKNASLGAVVALFTAFIPVLNYVFGGFVAGLAHGKSGKASATVGGTGAALVGIVVTLPLSFLFGVGGISAAAEGNVAAGLGALVVVLLIAVLGAVVAGALGALGGYVGYAVGS